MLRVHFLHAYAISFVLCGKVGIVGREKGAISLSELAAQFSAWTARLATGP